MGILIISEVKDMQSISGASGAIYGLKNYPRTNATMSPFSSIPSFLRMVVLRW